MHEPFFPQLALFVAGPSVIGLYREFIFPSVPRNTGLLPAALDDIGVTNQDNEPIAIDIALSRAALIVYDEGRRSRVPIEYVRMLHGTSPVVVVTAPTPRLASTRTQRPQSGNETTIDRPAEMGGWPQSFVEPLLGHIRAVAPPSPSADIGAELQRLTTEKSWSPSAADGARVARAPDARRGSSNSCTVDSHRRCDGATAGLLRAGFLGGHRSRRPAARLAARASAEG